MKEYKKKVPADRASVSTIHGSGYKLPLDEAAHYSPHQKTWPKEPFNGIPAPRSVAEKALRKLKDTQF